MHPRSVASARARGVRPWLTALLLLSGARTLAPADAPPIQVHLADGSSFPLLDWTFSYEYTVFRQGEPPGPPARRESRELWSGKRGVPLQGQTLGIEEGRILSLTDGAGKSSRLKSEAPHPDLLLPEGRRGRLVIPRSLDLRGTTLGGTNRQFCLVSYSIMVSCGGEDADRVVRIEFPAEAAP